MIEIRNLTKKYGEQTVLKNLSMRFDEGKVYVIKGVSGCGKTTLLNILAGLDSNYNGEVNLDDSQRKSYIFQESFLIDGLTVLENLNFITGNTKYSLELLKSFSLENIKDKKVSQLSGGQRQRVSILRALSNHPQLIFCDEPTASLDRKNADMVAKSIVSFKDENRIIIIATHDKCFDDLADEIIHLDYGRITQIEKKESLESHLEIPYANGKSDYKKINHRYIKQQYIRKKKNSFVLALIVFILLFIFGFAVNFEDNYMKKISENYPVDTFFFPTFKRAELEGKGVQVFENYFFMENGIECYPYYDPSLSGLNIEGVISEGEFPKNKEEVIINSVVADNKYQVGDTISIQNQEFVIEGIIEETPKIWMLYSSNPNYNRDPDVGKVYLDYEVMAQFGEKGESNTLMGYQKDLLNSKLMKWIDSELKGTYWTRYMQEAITQVNIFFNIFVIALAFASMVVFVFLYQDISLKLHYEKQKIAYFKILGIENKRIKKLFIQEHLQKTIHALSLSTIGYLAVCAGFKILLGYDLFGKILSMPIILMAIYIFEYLLIIFPLRKILKKDVLELLNP